MNRITNLVVLACLLSLAVAGPASALIVAGPTSPSESIIIPDIVEDEDFALDGGRQNTLHLVLATDYRDLWPGSSAANLPRSEEEVYVYLFRQSIGKEKLVLSEQGTPLCNPCTIKLGGAWPMRATVKVDFLIKQANGGHWPTSLNGSWFSGYAVIKAKSDLADVAVQRSWVDWGDNADGRVTPLAIERLQ